MTYISRLSHFALYLEDYFMYKSESLRPIFHGSVIVSPAKQKRDICIAFPAAALSSAAAV